jgi:hypothetical protein
VVPVKDKSQLRNAVRHLRKSLDEGFAPDTASPGFPGHTPSSGHCAAAALIANQVLGGQLVSARVKGKSHWFNRFPLEEGALDVDITGDQFDLPRIQIEVAGELFPGTRVRSIDQVHAETIERAIVLAKRSGLDDVLHNLRRALDSQKSLAYHSR